MWLLREVITTKNTKSSIRKYPEWIFAAIPIAATFIVWFGCTRSGFTPDDYMVIDVQSPIRTFIDVISMFWRHDPNPQYWRPFTDATVSLDFLLWGWNGGMFHLTNLFLHCIAVGLVYFFVRRIFSLSIFASTILALIFGISGSHDSNLLWIAARSDVIATIMILIVLLTAYKAEISPHKKILWLLLSYFSYFLALSSKEVSGVVIVLLPLLIYTSAPKELWLQRNRIFKNLLPYIILTALFIYIRLQFTIPLSEMQPLNAEGSHSFVAFAKNFLYSLGYIIAPIDFRTASLIINRYAAIGYISAIVIFISGFFLIKKTDIRKVFDLIYKPLILTIITGFVSFQSFERWRVYFPSVGVLAILVIVFTIQWNRYKNKKRIRPVLMLIAISFTVFHVQQAIDAEKIWERATVQLSGFSDDLKKILSDHPERPITLELVTSPTKLGGSPLFQLSKTYLLKKAEADLRNLSSLKDGVVSVSKDSISFETDLDMYALDPEKGFQSFIFKKTGENKYDIIGNKDEIGLFPNVDFDDGKARRDTKLLPGQNFETFGATITIESAESSFASHVKLHLLDTCSVHLYFDGQKIKELR